MFSNLHIGNSTDDNWKEYYTSDASNIPEAQGQDALVSLVGAIGYGLTYGGGIFVNQLVMRVENIKLVTLFGAVVTSLGLFLASFCTKVCLILFRPSLYVLFSYELQHSSGTFM